MEFHRNVTKFVSDETRKIFEVINIVFLCSIIGTLGIAGNVINMVVFHKQGFKNTVNIGFFGLAISDTSCLLSIIWGSICLNPVFAASGVKWFPMEVYYLSAAWPHVCFSGITGWVTVYITAERCLSIALPLTVKHIMTPKSATLIVLLIYLVNFVGMVPEYATSSLGWRFFLSLNETLIGIIFTSSRKNVEGIVHILHFTLGVVSFVGVILFTTVLVIKLGQSSDRRRKIMSSGSQHEAISTRDKKTVKVVVLIACVLIVCYSPGALISLASFIVGPEFGIGRRYVNICQAMWTTVIAVQTINSSVNIFIYYSMSSKYRQTFDEVMYPCKCSNYRPTS